MKRILSIFSALAFVLIIASCSKNPSKVLPKRDGKWNVTYTKTEDSKIESGKGTMTFTQSGFSLTYDALFGLAITGTWSYDEGSENITITYDNNVSVYKVSDMTRKSETWTKIDSKSTEVFKLTKP